MENLPPLPHLGHHLRRQRESNLLSIEDVADHLRLHKNMIIDLENGNFHKIPMPYLKGYLKAYAKFLSIPDILVSQYIEIVVHPNEIKNRSCQIFIRQKQVSASDKPIQWITYSIISILVILVALWWKSDNLLNLNLSNNDFMLGLTVAEK
jgi:cytoskeleton protein RodZ